MNMEFEEVVHLCETLASEKVIMDLALVTFKKIIIIKQGLTILTTYSVQLIL